MTLRLNRQELVELINSMEAGGGDASHLRAVLATLPQPAHPRPGSSRFREEEDPTTAEYLNMRVGDLFPHGITDEVLAQLIEMDRRYSLKELQAQCKEAGLSGRGDKKELAAKLVASGVATEKAQAEEVEMAEVEYVNLNQSREWTAEPNEELKIPEEYQTGLKYEVLILSSRKDFTPLKCKRYERDGQVVTLYDVIWDTSKKNARREIIQQVASWHEKIELLNIGCIIIPVPENEVLPPPAD